MDIQGRRRAYHLGHNNLPHVHPGHPGDDPQDNRSGADDYRDCFHPLRILRQLHAGSFLSQGLQLAENLNLPLQPGRDLRPSHLRIRCVCLYFCDVRRLSQELRGRRLLHSVCKRHCGVGARRTGQGGHHLQLSFRHCIRELRGQCCRHRKLHHPHDEEHGL